MTKNFRWINFNFNPWQKRDIGDCAIRAIVAATGLNYKEVCKKLGVSYIIGKGLRRDTGINLDVIEDKFADYFGVVEDYYQNFDFVPDEYKDSIENDELQAFELNNGIDSVSGNTLNDFCDQYAGLGVFLVSLHGGKGHKDDDHIVCAKLNKNAKKQGFIDTWDSGDMMVDAFMEVIKTEPKDSPLHWKFDYDKKKFIV